MSGIFVIIFAAAVASSVGLQVHEECTYKRGELFEVQFNGEDFEEVYDIDVDDCGVSIDIYRKVYLDDRELSVDIYRKCDTYNLSK